MILLSVGTQLPFDRLVKAVDRWAADHRDIEVIAQIGPSNYIPLAMKSETFIDQARFRELQAQCSLMISHAGIGSIINALEMGKPIIILSRDHRRNEHRNGHQISTVERFSHLPGIYAARDEHQLIEFLDCAHTLTRGQDLTDEAVAGFIHNLRDYVASARPTPLWRNLWRACREVL